MKKVLPSVVITSLMLCACANNVIEGYTEATAANGENGGAGEVSISDGKVIEPFTLEDQIALIASKKDVWYNEDTEGVFEIKYAISDLDNDELMEIIVASQEKDTLYTFYYVYEVNAGATNLVMLEDTIIEPNSFPDIIQDNIDIYTINSIDYYAVTDEFNDGSDVVEIKSFMYVDGNMIQHMEIARATKNAGEISYSTETEGEVELEKYETAFGDFFGEEVTLVKHFNWADSSELDVSNQETLVSQLTALM